MDESYYGHVVSMPKNVIHHEKICEDLNTLYAQKNHDYGDSFHETFLEEGMAMVRIRLSDKLNRFKKLTKNSDRKVNDESIRDTLMDLANYSIMAVMEIDNATGGYANVNSQIE